MREGTDPAVLALTGSANRAKTLAVLANSATPLTAYRIAKTSGGQKIKVNTELRRLTRAGLVTPAPTAQGKPGWQLTDEDVRRFLRRRIRVMFPDEWDDGRRLSGEEVDRFLREVQRELPNPGRNPAFYRPKGWAPTLQARRTVLELQRDPEKDRILRKYGARTSRREGRGG